MTNFRTSAKANYQGMDGKYHGSKQGERKVTPDVGLKQGVVPGIYVTPYGARNNRGCIKA